jgi:hypothetical protein
MTEWCRQIEEKGEGGELGKPTPLASKSEEATISLQYSARLDL